MGVRNLLHGRSPATKSDCCFGNGTPVLPLLQMRSFRAAVMVPRCRCQHGSTSSQTQRAAGAGSHSKQLTAGTRRSAGRASGGQAGRQSRMSAPCPRLMPPCKTLPRICTFGCGHAERGCVTRATSPLWPPPVSGCLPTVSTDFGHRGTNKTVTFSET